MVVNLADLTMRLHGSSSQIASRTTDPHGPGTDPPCWPGEVFTMPGDSFESSLEHRAWVAAWGAATALLLGKGAAAAGSCRVEVWEKVWLLYSIDTAQPKNNATM